MSSRRALGALLALSLLSACGPHALTPAAGGPGAASGSLTPKALQQNNGAQFVEYAGLACSEALGQVSLGTAGNSMWFAIPTLCNKTGGGVGKVTVSTGAVTTYRIGKKASPLVIAESGGYVWAVDQHRSGKGRNIYRLNEDGTYKTFTLPSAIAVNGLAAGPDGNLWFCGSYVKGGATQAGVGNITPAGVGTLYAMQGAATPVLTSIDAAPDGNLWVADQQNGAILRVTTSGAVTTFTVGGHPNNITNSTNAVIYSDSSVGQLSVMNFSGKFTVYAAPGGQFPGSIANQGNGIIAYIDTANNSQAVGNFDSTAGTYASEAKAPNAGLRYTFGGPDGNAWFTDAYGHIGAYLAYILTTKPTQISLSATTCSASFSATESNFNGDLAVASQNTSIATVSPGSGLSGSKFTVTSVSTGTTSILVQDTMRNIVSVPVTVSAPCQSGNNCPALSGGTGLLQDGDFSGALNEFQTFSKGQTMAPNWLVTQATVDIYGNTLWGEPTPNNLCSVDLDGSPGVGGIQTDQLPTVAHKTYQVTFYFSANTYGPPSTKQMLVSAAGTSETLTWNDSNGGAPQGVWVQESWEFVATGSNTTLAFTSQDQNGTDYGAVIEGITVGAVNEARRPGFRVLKTFSTSDWARVLPSPTPR